MAQREGSKPGGSTGADPGLEALDRRPDMSELCEGEVMGAGRDVIREGQVRNELSRRHDPGPAGEGTDTFR